MLALGLNSGSSFDGVDSVLADIDVGTDCLLKRPRCIARKSVDWPKRIAEHVLAALQNKLSIFEALIAGTL
jgi:anhydro-N-acetylmuramic acid kinase